MARSARRASSSRRSRHRANQVVRMQVQLRRCGAFRLDDFIVIDRRRFHGQNFGRGLGNRCCRGFRSGWFYVDRRRFIGCRLDWSRLRRGRLCSKELCECRGFGRPGSPRISVVRNGLL